jgi:hypothetical protein
LSKLCVELVGDVHPGQAGAAKGRYHIKMEAMRD